jgi:hypothetical protein
MPPKAQGRAALGLDSAPGGFALWVGLQPPEAWSLNALPEK